jgi:phosphoglycerate dehydrogenase-like enzyme
MFERMKPSAYFIKIGRGKSVVTDDLVAPSRPAALPVPG